MEGHRAGARYIRPPAGGRMEAAEEASDQNRWILLEELPVCKKTVDGWKKSGIIYSSAMKIPKQLYSAQYTTGGRLGVRLCQM